MILYFQMDTRRTNTVSSVVVQEVLGETMARAQSYTLYSALLISDFWYLFFKPTWFQRSTSNFRWIREDIRAK